jgi:DNA-binding CsgD family transcriptional regulator
MITADLPVGCADESGSPLGPLLDALSPAERLVAGQLAQGLSNKEISLRLGKTEFTVKNQVSSILLQTGVPSRARFIALYYQQFLCLLPAASTRDSGPVGRGVTAVPVQPRLIA